MAATGLIEELTGERRRGRRGTPLSLVDEVRDGFPFERAERAYRRLGFTLEEVADSVGVPARTLHRRKKEGARLDRSESEKMLRLARVGAAAFEVFGDEAHARAWLRSPIRALGHVTPASLLDTDVGAQAVLDVLTRIDHGVYS